ncbi:MAG: hypothetical protein AB7K09_24960 [Planctomycetota bacterium]
MPSFTCEHCGATTDLTGRAPLDLVPCSGCGRKTMITPRMVGGHQVARARARKPTWWFVYGGVFMLALIGKGVSLLLDAAADIAPTAPRPELPVPASDFVLGIPSGADRPPELHWPASKWATLPIKRRDEIAAVCLASGDRQQFRLLIDHEARRSMREDRVEDAIRRAASR